LPLIGAAAAGAALAVKALAGRGAQARIEAAIAADAELLGLELELALERRQMRRALAARLTKEHTADPARVPAGDLRAALVNRDFAEDECEALDRLLSKVRDRLPSAR
jgi:hypothetical protein